MDRNEPQSTVLAARQRRDPPTRQRRAEFQQRAPVGAAPRPFPSPDGARSSDMNEELQVCRALICLLFRFAVKRGMIDGRDLIDMAMADLHLPPKVSARVIEAVNEAVREVVDNPRWPG